MTEKDAARQALKDFLSTRRARTTPAQAGLPAHGTRRRVSGLRREEVALLAGISPEYYVRLERGSATSPSPGVVESVAAALGLDEDERAHLERLLAALTPLATRGRRSAPKQAVSPGMRVLLDSLDHLPAMVLNGRLDVLAVNDLARLLYAPMFEVEASANTARFMFLAEDRARALFPAWERLADDTVALLRIQAGVRPDEPGLVALVGQLSTRSAAFAARWAANDVRAHRRGAKVFRHPLVGEVELPFESLRVDAAADQSLTVFTPEPGSAADEVLRLLASWEAATPGGGSDPGRGVSDAAESAGRP